MSANDPEYPQIDEETFRDLLKDISETSIELLISIGLFGAVATQWTPEVQFNFYDKIQSLNLYLQQQIEEVQEFASAYDV